LAIPRSLFKPDGRNSHAGKKEILMSQEMQNFALLKSAAIQATRYWSKFWKYRIGEFSIEGWCWIAGFLVLGIYLLFGLLNWVSYADFSIERQEPERTQVDVLEDILEEMKK
jgi:hypothetical protein